MWMTEKVREVVGAYVMRHYVGHNDGRGVSIRQVFYSLTFSASIQFCKYSKFTNSLFEEI